MKKILFAISAAAVMLAGCRKTDIIEESGVGSVAFTFTSDESGYVTKALPEVDVNTLAVKITGKDGGYSQEWKSVSEMPEILELASGTYTLTASTPGAKAVAWDQPVYGGSKDFAVVVGKVSNVDLVCSITNMMVTLNPTENFLNELTSWEVTVRSQDGTLVWDEKTYEEDRAAFFNVAPLSVLVKGERFDGAEVVQQSLSITDVAAKDHHILNLDAQVTGSIEQGGLHLTVDNTVNDKNENIHIPGFDEIPVEDDDDPDTPGGDDKPQPSTAPTMVWESNPDFEVTPITVPMKDITIRISAPEGIKDFVVKVESETEGFLSTVSAMVSSSNSHLDEGYVILDLIGDQTAIGTLGSLFPTGEALEDQVSVDFTLTELVPMINGFTPESGAIHTFTLTVTDNKGQSLSQPVSFVTK